MFSWYELSNMAQSSRKNELYIHYWKTNSFWRLQKQNMEWCYWWVILMKRNDLQNITLQILVSSFYNLLQKCSRIYILGMLHREEIDIAPQGFSVSKGRASVVDFLPGIAPNYVQLFIRNPATLHNWVAYLEPLRWSCWFAILAFLVIAPPIVAAISFCGRNSCNCKKFWQCNIKTNRIIETKIER